MLEDSSQDPESQSVRAAMDEAWREQRHSRDQTWTAVKMTAALVVGLVAIEIRFDSDLATGFVAAFVFLESLAAIQITLHHRRHQITKVRHAMKCEESLKLRKLICNVTEPSTVTFWHIFWSPKPNTVVFIMRLLFFMGVFALAFFITAYLT